MCSTALVRAIDDPACLSENPHGLVTVWDMLRIYAANFVRVGACLEKCAGGGIGLAVAPHGTATDDVRESFADLVQTIGADCLEMQLPVTSEIVSYYLNWLNIQRRQSFGEIAHAVAEIHRAYQAEVRTKVLVHIAPERSIYLGLQSPFGEEVEDAFPGCAQEIIDAAGCYAFEQDTACVMHLMRVLEFGLTALAQRFGVDSSREQWHAIIRDIEKQVDALSPASGPDWKDQKERFAPACKEFRYFKDAWRNHAMHARVRYSGPEAKRIWDHTQDFMKHLSHLLS